MKLSQEIESESTLKAEPRIFLFLLLIIVAIASLMGTGFLILNALESTYLQLEKLISVSFLFVLGLISLVTLWNMNSYKLDGQKLQIIPLFTKRKRILYLSDISSYTEYKKQNKFEKWYILTLFTSKGKFKIISSTITNYEALKKILTKDKPVKKVGLSKYPNLKLWLVFGIIFLIPIYIIYSAFSEYTQRNHTIKANQLVTLHGTLADYPKINKTSGKGSKGIYLKLEEYPEFSFNLDELRFDATKVWALEHTLSPGDSLEVDITKSEYGKRIKGTEDLSLMDKTVGFYRITVNGLRSNTHVFLGLESINGAYKKQRSQAPLMILLLLIAIILSSKGFNRKLRKFLKYE